MKIEKHLIIYTDGAWERQKVQEKFPEAGWIPVVGTQKCTFFLSAELDVETVRRILDEH